jgi:hypothetical protein
MGTFRLCSNYLNSRAGALTGAAYRAKGMSMSNTVRISTIGRDVQIMTGEVAENRDGACFVVDRATGEEHTIPGQFALRPGNRVSICWTEASGTEVAKDDRIKAGVVFVTGGRARCYPVIFNHNSNMHFASKPAVDRIVPVGIAGKGCLIGLAWLIASCVAISVGLTTIGALGLIGLPVLAGVGIARAFRNRRAFVAEVLAAVQRSPSA